MLTLAEVKAYLNETTTTYDTFLTDQEAIIAGAIEGYCGRIFSQTSYVQRFYDFDYRVGEGNLLTYHFPLISVTSIKEFEDGTEMKTLAQSGPDVEVRIHKPTGQLINVACGFFQDGNEVVVTYSAGYTSIPWPIKSVLLSLIEERYNKKKAGVEVNFGSDVQRISIPGTISIDFDYSLQANERKIAFGTIVGNYVNVLDSYRSERNIVGSGKLAFID